MTLPAPHLQKRFRYHHGQLREALLDAAVSLLAEHGVEGLSLRALGNATGVTPSAPYSYFRNKDELLAAVAETGFQRLAFQMADLATGASTTQERIEKLSAAYLRFALENRALFQVMFGRELGDMKKYPTLAMTAGKSYSLISAALAKRASFEIDTRFLTVSVWSLCHGLAMLLVDDRLKIEQFGAATADDFAKKTVAIFAGHLV